MRFWRSFAKVEVSGRRYVVLVDVWFELGGGGGLVLGIQD